MIKFTTQFLSRVHERFIDTHFNLHSYQLFDYRIFMCRVELQSKWFAP